MAVTGTQLYNKDKKNIYPKSDATVISCDASGTMTTVYQDIVNLYAMVADLSGDNEAISNIQFMIDYKLGKTALEGDIRGSEGWNATPVEPTRDYPYAWKRTTFKTVSNQVVKYEIYRIGDLEETIYCSTSPGEAAFIEYQKDAQGNEILSQYDQVLPKGWSYEPKPISESAPNAYQASRKRKEDGSWGRFSEPIQYGRWAFDSSITMRFQITDSIDNIPEVDVSNINPGELWVEDNKKDFTGYLWMINATEVASTLQSYKGIIWRGPILLSIVK